MYVANTPLKFGESLRGPGQPVPEAIEWPIAVLNAYLNQRKIVDVDEKTAKKMREKQDITDHKEHEKTVEGTKKSLQSVISSLERRVESLATEYDEAQKELEEVRQKMAKFQKK